MKSINKLVLAAIFVALCVIGAYIKIMGSIAFDSMAAYLSALILGPTWGAAIAAVGHMITAATSGFPLTLPVHLATCLTMVLTMVVFFHVKKLACKKLSLVPSLVITVIAGALMNGPVCLLILSPLLVPIMGMPGIVAMMPVLTLVGGLNAAIAAIIYKLLPTSLTGDKLKS